MVMTSQRRQPYPPGRGRPRTVGWVIVGGLVACAGGLSIAACALDFEHYRPPPGQVCRPGATQPCYPLDDGSEGVGLCVAGLERCRDDGTGFSDCEGAVVPSVEDCALPSDEDCDGLEAAGQTDDDCLCEPLAVTSCYDGPEDRAGHGACIAGTWECDASGAGYGPCEGQVLPAGELCETVVDENCDDDPRDHCAAWALRFGDDKPQTATAIAPTTSSAGHWIAVGNFIGSIFDSPHTLSPPGDAAYVVAVDPADGTVANAVAVTGSYLEELRDVAIDAAGDVYIAGLFRTEVTLGDCGTLAETTPSAGTEVFVAKLSGDTLDCLWAERAGGADESTPWALAVEGDLVVVAGQFGLVLNFGGGSPGSLSGDDRDSFVAAFDAESGTPRWQVAFDGAGQADAASGVALMPWGAVVVGRVNAESVTWPGGDTDLIGDRLDGYAVLLDRNDGHALPWMEQRLLGGLGDQEGKAAARSGDEVLITGTFQKDVSLCGVELTAPVDEWQTFVAKIGQNGACADGWPQTITGPGTQSVRAIAAGPAGRVGVAVELVGDAEFNNLSYPGAGSQDMLVTLFSADGEPLWARRFGDDLDQSPGGIALSSSHLIVAGDCQGEVDFGTGALSPNPPVPPAEINSDGCIAGLKLTP